MSRLFFVIALLVSGIPIFSVTQIFGGVAISSITMSFAIAAATAFVTGALAMAIATFKVGTRRTIFSFYLFVVIYLVGIYLLDTIPYFHVLGPKTSTGTSHISWFTGIHPFLALRVIIGDPAIARRNPACCRRRFRRGRAVVLHQPGQLLRGADVHSQPAAGAAVDHAAAADGAIHRHAQGVALQKLRLSTGDRNRNPRTVWHNPIAWREAKTKASAARASILRYGFIAAGVVGALVMVFMFSSYSEAPPSTSPPAATTPTPTRCTSTAWACSTSRPTSRSCSTAAPPAPRRCSAGSSSPAIPPSASRNRTRARSPRSPSARWAAASTSARPGSSFSAPVILEFAVILLIVTNAAASTVTREKEDGSLDLLLTTPITSRYYIWGKLRGLVSFVLPLVAVPVLSAGLFIFYDIIRLLREGDVGFRWIVFPEALLIMPGTLIIVAAFASILGMHMSLRCRTTVRAVMSSVGIMLGACATLGWCGITFLGQRGGSNPVTLALANFSPFTVLMLLIDPWSWAPSAFSANNPTDVNSNRIVIFVVSWIATAAYAMLVWSMYKSMVKNFDMTIRRQSR
jgi:hypothetical protein